MTSAAFKQASSVTIWRADLAAPILFAAGRTEIGIKAGTRVKIGAEVRTFDADTPIALGELTPGSDYGIGIDEMGEPFAKPLDADPLGGRWVGGFHFAPGGCAPARAGGDAIPAVNPFSLWDVGFRFAGPDPRGMALAQLPEGRRVWVDIYMLGTDHHEHGTSRYGAVIADGRDLPMLPSGERAERLDFGTAQAIYAHHGKRLLTYDEYRVAALGVTEKSAAGKDPKKTGLDAPRTSRIGLMQASGNLWAWGMDGDPDDPRPSLLGGSWLDGGDAGSRFAPLGYWPEASHGDLSARGGGDHLNPAS